MGASESRPERRQPVTPPVTVQSVSRSLELETPWRSMNWGQKAELIQRLEEFIVNHYMSHPHAHYRSRIGAHYMSRLHEHYMSRPHEHYMKILLVGEVGAGKSSFINSVKSAFLGRIASGAVVDSAAACSSRSFTQRLTAHRIQTTNCHLPFVMCDTMGLEATAMSGSQPEDIIKAVFGHVKDGYKFQQNQPITCDSEHYERNPDLCEQAFCVVYIIAADKVQFMGEQICEKLRLIRKRISDMGIPQVVVMTRVDEVCTLVNCDLKKIYTSMKIKHKMEMCSCMLGVPMSHIFPVKNYHEEIDTDDVKDILILKAVEQIVHLANDKLMEHTVH